MLNRLYRRLLTAAFEADDAELLDQPEIAVIQRRRRSETPADWGQAQAHLDAAEACRSTGDVYGALAHQRAAFAHTSPTPDLLLHNASTLLTIRAYDVAAMVLRQALALRPDHAGLHIHLAHALWGQSRELGLAQCAQMVKVFPTDAAVIETAVLMSVEADHAALGLEWALRCIARLQGEPPIALLVQTARAIIRSGVEPPEHLQQLLTARRSVPELAAAAEMIAIAGAARDAWQNLVAGGSPLGVSNWSAAALDLLVGALPPPRVLSFADPALSQRLAHGTLVVDALERDGFVLPPTRPVIDHGYLTTNLDYRRTLVDAAVRIQLAALKTGFVTLHSPFGGIVSSTTGTILNYSPADRHMGSDSAFYFAGARPLFVFFVGEEHWPMAWYDPVTDTVMRHSAMSMYDLYLQARVVDVKRAWLDDPARTARYVAAGALGRRDISLLFGMMNYLSTHLFSDLAGMQRIVEAGLTALVSRVIVTGDEPLGTIETLFPQLAGATVVRMGASSLAAINAKFFEENILPLRIAGGFVDDATAARVVRLAVSRSDPAAENELAVIRAHNPLLLLVSLRAHGRRWLNAAAQIGTMLGEIDTQGRRMAILFDGYSAGPGVSAADIERAQAANREIAAALPRTTDFFHIDGRPLSTAIMAALQCDFHLSAQGTTASKAVLIAGKPGVVVGPRQFGWDVRAFRDTVPHLETIWEAANDVVDGDIQSDFFLEPAIVRRALEIVIRSNFASDVRASVGSDGA